MKLEGMFMFRKCYRVKCVVLGGASSFDAVFPFLRIHRRPGNDPQKHLSHYQSSSSGQPCKDTQDSVSVKKITINFQIF